MINRSWQGHTAPQLCLTREYLIDKVVLVRDHLEPSASVAGEDGSGANSPGTQVSPLTW